MILRNSCSLTSPSPSRSASSIISCKRFGGSTLGEGFIGNCWIQSEFQPLFSCVGSSSDQIFPEFCFAGCVYREIWPGSVIGKVLGETKCLEQSQSFHITATAQKCNWLIPFLHPRGLKPSWTKKSRDSRNSPLPTSTQKIFLPAPAQRSQKHQVQTCSSSSVRFSPSSLATRLRFLKEIFPVSSSSKSLKALRISSLESFSAFRKKEWV